LKKSFEKSRLVPNPYKHLLNLNIVLQPVGDRQLGQSAVFPAVSAFLPDESELVPEHGVPHTGDPTSSILHISVYW